MANHYWSSDKLEAQPQIVPVNISVRELKQKYIASLTWITQNLDFFIPWEEGFLTDARVKAFAELSVLYGQLKQREKVLNNHIPETQEHLLLWSNFLSQHTEDIRFAEMARKRPWQSIYLLLPYLVLRALSYRYSYHEETLNRMKRYGYPAALEVLPYRMLDYKYYLWKSGYLSREPNWKKLYRYTTLGCSRSLIYLDKDAAYSITHTLFYLTDFGNRPAPLNAIQIKHAIDVVESLLIHYWRLSHWDLVGELLIGLNSLGGHESLLYTKAVRAFGRAWRDDGTVPATREEEYRLDTTAEPERNKLRFSACYHTTMVALLYGSTAFFISKIRLVPN